MSLMIKRPDQVELVDLLAQYLKRVIDDELSIIAIDMAVHNPPEFITETCIRSIDWSFDSNGSPTRYKLIVELQENPHDRTVQKPPDPEDTTDF